MKIKKYFKIAKEQSDELLRDGVLLIKDEKILDTYYKISERLELILREVQENGGSKEGYKYFKLKIENNLGEKTKIKDEKEIKIRLGIGLDSIEEFLSKKGLVPFMEREMERKEFPKGTITVRIDTENGNSTCRLQSEAEKDKINEVILKIENFAKQYGLEELEEKEELCENKEITTPKIKMK